MQFQTATTAEFPSRRPGPSAALGSWPPPPVSHSPVLPGPLVPLVFDFLLSFSSLHSAFRTPHSPILPCPLAPLRPCRDSALVARLSAPGSQFPLPAACCSLPAVFCLLPPCPPAVIRLLLLPPHLGARRSLLGPPIPLDSPRPLAVRSRRCVRPACKWRGPMAVTGKHL